MSTSVDSLRAFVARNGRGVGPDPHPGVVVFGAGKGGVGTSTVAALVALAGAERGLDVLLVDADENVGSQHLLLGITDPGPGIGSLRGGARSPEDLVLDVAPGLKLLPGGGAGDAGTLAAAVAERRALLARVSSLYSRFDLIVVDGGSRLESVMAACRTGAERLLAVTAPDRISLAAGYALFKVAKARYPDMPVEVIVNGASARRADDVFHVVHTAAETFLSSPVGFAGSVPEDPTLRANLDAGVPLPLAGPGSAAQEVVAHWTPRLLSRHSRATAIALL
jgi:MinD-like ATPase involved in chromosome partitioning or flagellar assembly